SDGIIVQKAVFPEVDSLDGTRIPERLCQGGRCFGIPRRPSCFQRPLAFVSIAVHLTLQDTLMDSFASVHCTH
ncbi:hypothetical protein AVEN_152297-1, partial [Araneus ventricosus]